VVLQLIHLYLHGSCVSHPAWGAIGLGLRLAQDMGAHRRKSYGDKPTVDGELMKRAFWYAVVAFVNFGLLTGREGCSSA
jgi:hypothetical protein